MSAKFNYKIKNRLLFTGAVLFIFISYRLAIKKTYIEYEKYNELKGQIDFAKDIPLKAAELKIKISSMDKMMQVQNRGEINSQQELLQIVTNYCKENKVVLKEFPETIQSTESDFLMQTNIFKIEGPFIKLLELLYILEQKRKSGKIASVLFQTKTDFKTKTLALTATVYFQHVTKLKE